MRPNRLIVFALISPLLVSCRATTSPPPALPAKPHVARILEAGFDPTPPNALSRASIGATVIPGIADEFDALIMRATDHKTTITSTIKPEDEDAAYAQLQDIIHHVIPVTDLCAYFDALASAYEKTTDKKVMIVIFSDGLDDGNATQTSARIQKAAARLASNSNVLGVVVVGTMRDTRPKWVGLAEMLAPLKDRAHIIPSASMTPTAVEEEVEAIAAKGPNH